MSNTRVGVGWHHTHLENEHNVVGDRSRAGAVLEDVLTKGLALACASDVRPRVVAVVKALRGQHHVGAGRRRSCNGKTSELVR